MAIRFSLARLFPFLFADDIFLSYSRKDGNAYAAALARELTAKKYKVFFDHYGAPPGEELPKEVIAKALGAKMFVLIASDEALASRHVRTEVEVFVNKRHKQNKGVFQCINFGRFNETEWVSNSKLNTISYISEEAPSIQGNKPSQTVVNFISDSFVYNKSNYKLRRAAMTLGIIMFVMAAIGTYFTQQAIASSAELERQSSLLDSLQSAEQEARAATGQARKDLAQAQEDLTEAKGSRDSIDNLRRLTQEELTATTTKLAAAAKDLASLENKLTETTNALTLSDQTKKEVTKQDALRAAKENFNKGNYSAAYSTAFGALKDNQAFPGKAGSDFCIPSYVTAADLGLLFIAGMADNFRISSPGEIGAEEVKSLNWLGSKIILWSDKGVSAFEKKEGEWAEVALPSDDEILSLKEIPSINGVVSVEKDNNYLDDDSVFYVKYYDGNDKEIRVASAAKIEYAFGSWHPNFYILHDDLSECLAVLAQPQYADESDYLLKVWFFKAEDSKLIKVSETALPLTAGTAISAIDFSKKNGLIISTSNDSLNESIQLGGHVFSTKNVTTVFNGYRQVQSIESPGGTISLLEKEGNYFIASSGGNADDLSLIEWGALESVAGKKVSIEVMGKDSLLVSLRSRSPNTSQAEEFKLLCEKNNGNKYVIRQTKRIGVSDYFVYDPFSHCYFFSKGSKMYFQPLYSELEFELGTIPEDIAGIYCTADDVIVLYSCQTDRGTPCISFASFNKPFIKKVPSLHEIASLPENQSANNFTSGGIAFDDKMNFYRTSKSNGDIDTYYCPQADSIYTFLYAMDPGSRNKIRFFSSREEFENIGEWYSNPDPEGWADGKIIRSRDGRWLFVLIEDALEVVDLIDTGNLNLNLAMPGINIDHATESLFSASGDYLFIRFKDFIYRLSMPGLMAKRLRGN